MKPMMKPDDLFAFAAATARETFAITPLRHAVVQPPITAKDGPRPCCSDFAAPDEISNGSTIYRCGICQRLFAVPHR